VEERKRKLEGLLKEGLRRKEQKKIIEEKDHIIRKTYYLYQVKEII